MRETANDPERIIEHEIFIPGILEPVVGWRVWEIQEAEDGNAYLCSLFVPSGNIELRRWGQFNHAICYSNHSIRKKCERPEFNCQCGFYACVSLLELIKRLSCNQIWGNFAVGEAALAGKIVEHQKGYRAEYARPRMAYLFYRDEDGLYRAKILKHKLEERYEISVMLFRELGNHRMALNHRMAIWELALSLETNLLRRWWMQLCKKRFLRT